MPLSTETALPKNIVSQPPLMSPMVDSKGNLTRSWSIWFRDLYDRTANKRGNAIDALDKETTDIVTQVLINIENIAANGLAIAVNSDNIQINADNIAINVEKILENTLAISENADQILINSNNISTNASNIVNNTANIAANAASIVINANNIATLTSDFGLHVEAETAHGSNGAIVGKDDLATSLVAGLVKTMASLADLTSSTATIVLPDIGLAPAAYDQAYAQSVTDMTNEAKLKINQLTTDLNATIDKVNSIISESKLSGQMDV